MFTIEKRDGMARTGVMHLPNGDVPTPAFMPVGTNGAVKAISHKELSDMGYKLILGNTYHIYLRPGMDVIEAANGLREFSSWKHNILTDSGGFQVFSLAPFRKITDSGVKFQSHIDGSYHVLTPEKVVQIQQTFKSDIMMPLDICTPPKITKKEALEALIQTTKWAKRSVDVWKTPPAGYDGKLFGIVQGNFFKDLRKQSAEEIINLDTPGIAIGGLSVGESPEMFNEYLAYTAALLPSEKPHYVMGIGTPDYMLEAVENGIDIFDCVYPTRIARNGTCFTRDGLMALKWQKNILDQDPIDNECQCETCRNYSKSYLRHMFKAKEILGPMLVTRHNLFFLKQMMNEVRQSIEMGTFTSYKNNFLNRYRKV